MDEPILRTVNIKKSFFENEVLKGIDFEVCSGEVMGIVGENGAGKSTLMKIITGLYTCDSGEILLEGSTVKFNDPSKARDAGISIIYQEFNQFSHLSVAENIFLDRKKYRNSFGKIKWSSMIRDARKVLQELGAAFDVTLPIRLLSVREQQLVEIAKAVSANAKVLIMDEPSAALPENEVHKMFEVINVLKKKGVAIIYISHRMKEIEQVCDRVTILRDGMNVGVVKMAPGIINDIISLMIGREIQEYYPHSKRETGKTALSVRGVSGDGLKDIELEVHENEVVGLYGLAGSGSTELAEMIMGLRRMTRGSVTRQDRKIKPMSVKSAMNAGIGYVPPDRRKEGVVVNLPINNNVILANLKKYDGRLMLKRRRVAESVGELISSLQIKCTGQNQQVLRLSGGNQQKVVLAKWLDRTPTVLIMNEPTRGVDVGAKSEIYRLIDRLANKGLAIILISSELPEILGISDKVIVMCRGHITGTYVNENLGQDVLLKAASGSPKGEWAHE